MSTENNSADFEAAAAAWLEAYERVDEIVGLLVSAQVRRVVPATPAWTAQQLFCHMVGVGVDTLAGVAPDVRDAAWTQGHVEARRGRSVTQLLAEFAGVGAAMPDWMRENGPRPLGDLVIHEQDLRGAVAAFGAHDNRGLVLVRETMAGRFGHALAADLPPVGLVGEQWAWCSTGDAADAADAPVRVRAPDFELARAVMSRRSEQQLRTWTEAGDISAYLPAFAHLGALPTEPLAE